MRRAGEISYDAIVDNTRWIRQPNTFDDLAHSLTSLMRSYRRTYWRDKEIIPFVAIEKDALSAVIEPVTDAFDVPLHVSRSYSSISYARDIANAIKREGKSVVLYYLGDFDPSGMDARRALEAEIREHLAHLDDLLIDFISVALNDIDQVTSERTARSDGRDQS
jgi:hypothetical protein